MDKLELELELSPNMRIRFCLDCLQFFVTTVETARDAESGSSSDVDPTDRGIACDDEGEQRECPV
jgi:hypothetical protein